MKLKRTAFFPVYWWRKLTRPKRVRIDGFRVGAEHAPMDPAAWKGLWRGVHERTERSLIAEVVRPDDRVLEGGGGIGLVTLHILKIIRSGAVLVYEPVPGAARDIVGNAAASLGVGVNVAVAALSDHDGDGELTIGASFIGASLHDRGHPSTIKVKLVDIARVVAEFRPTVLVLDIEGAEIEVLRRRPIHGIRAILMETHPTIVGVAATEAMTAGLIAAGLTLDKSRSRNDTLCFERVSLSV